MFTLKTNIDDIKVKNNKRYKVLLNAGGGVYGYIITRLMANLDQDIYQKIDVAAGTSIGGILTLLYSVNNDYKWINELFEKGCPQIFDPKFLGGIVGPKYPNDALGAFIQKVVGDAKLSDIKKLNKRDLNIIIPTLDYTLIQPRIFDNINDNVLKHGDIDLKTIALATSSAPTYFPAIDYLWRGLNIKSEQDLNKIPISDQILFLTKQAFQYQLKENCNATDCLRQSVLVDGGVIQNIPIVTTYTTLRSKLGVEAKDIDMFVIGTGDDASYKSYTAEQINKWTAVDWLIKFLIPYVTESNQLTSVYWGSLFGFNSFCYYNPLKVAGGLDDISQIPYLKQKCDEVAEDFKTEIYNFLNK